VVGFAPCARCGLTWCDHLTGAASSSSAEHTSTVASRPVPSATTAKEAARAAARERLTKSAADVFDSIDALVMYRVYKAFNRDRRERDTIQQMRSRFVAGADCFRPRA
jgi:hypothetical protein